MREEIYINGVAMDLAEGKELSLVYQSPFFTDIDNIVSNRTNSAEFPLTRNNLNAIERADLLSSESVFAYRRHTAKYIRNGVEIFNGFATLISITDTVAKFTFTWGNVSLFQKLLDIKIRDLQGEDDYVTYTKEGVSGQFGRVSNAVYWGTDAAGNKNAFAEVGGKVVWLWHPCVRVPDLLQRLAEASGVTIDVAPFAGLVMPCPTKELDVYAKRRNGVVADPMAATRNTTIISDYGFVSGYINFRTAITQNLKGWAVTRSTYLNVVSIENLGLYFEGDWLDGWPSAHYEVGGDLPMRMVVWGSTNPGSTSAERIIATFKAKATSVGNENYLVGTFMAEGTVDVSDYDWIEIRVFCDSEAFGYRNKFDVYVYDNDDTEVYYGGQFPTYRNLPDWTGSQLLKNLMKMFGLFPRCTGDSRLGFMTVAELYSNRADAPDWSGKLILDRGRASEIVPTFGSYARKNIMSYADDDTNTATDSGVIEIDSDLLDAETELVRLDFANTETAMGRPFINAYSVGEDGDVSFSAPTPRILKMSGKLVTSFTFAGLEWESLLRNYYARYSQIVNHPKVIKVAVLLSVFDLVGLDLTKPVYLEQWGHYYVVNKLTTKENGKCEVELLQMNN